MNEHNSKMICQRLMVRWHRWTLAPVLGVALLVACGNPDPDGAAQATQSTVAETIVEERTFAGAPDVRDVWGSWEAFVAVTELSHYSSTADMVIDSPIIVDGIVADTGPSRTAGPAEDPVRYALLTIQVVEYLKGGGPDLLPIEVFIGGHEIEANRDELVGSRLLGFVIPQDEDLRRAGASDDEIAEAVGRYRFSNSQSLFVSSLEGLVQPYAEPGSLDILSISEKPYDLARDEVRSLIDG